MSDDFFEGLDETKALLRPKETANLPGGENAWRVLYDISNLFNSPVHEFEDILGIILDATIRITGADRGFLMLFNDGEELEVKLAKNMNYAGLPEEERRVSQGIVDEVLSREEAIFIANVEDSGKFSELSSIMSLKILSVMCVPLKITLRAASEEVEHRVIGPVTTRKILGVIYVDSRSVAHNFNEASLELLQALANNATTAILNSTLYRQATTDQQTGLYTRRHFEQRLRDEVKLARRHNSPLWVLMVDVNGMKKFNSSLGYTVGDRILARIAEICRLNIRSIDLAARYGGNKFTIILPQTDETGAEAVAQKVMKAVSETHFFPGDPAPKKVTVSVGGAFLQPNMDAESLTKRADKALYQAKLEGGNLYRNYVDELATTAKRTDRLAGVFSGDPSRDYRNFLMLLETIEEINKRTNFDELLPLVIDVIIDLAEAERGLLLLIGNDGQLGVKVARDRNKRPIDALDFSRSVVDRVMELDQPVRETFTSDSALISHSIGKLEIQAVLCVPLTIQEHDSERRRALGAIYVDRRERGGEFEESTLAFFDTLARQISVAIENARLYSRNEDLRKQLAHQLDRTKEELNYVKIELADRERQIEHKYNYDKIIGKSPRMLDLFRMLDKITDNTVSVFIHGESGTGKELVANAIHYNGPRRKKRLVSENCAAMTESLLESELFGYTKGSFTGAVADRKGLFEVATGGTLFLDEVGDMSTSMQTKLLRVIQEGEVRRVGGKETIKIDVRIISASNKDLKKLVEAGKFREDLYYRLNVVKVSLPQLRERKEDIPMLADHFLKEEDGEERSFSHESMQMLILYNWPGNVRELKNVVDRARIISDGLIIKKDAIILDSAFGPASSLNPLSATSSPSIPMIPGFGGSPNFDPVYTKLNERQRKLIEYLKTYGRIKNRDYYGIMKVSKSTGWRDIKDLIARSILDCHGKGKGSVYTLVERDKWQP
jgi:Nif-specific regulatory protein